MPVKRSPVRGHRQITPFLLFLALSACSGNLLDSFNPFNKEEDESLRGTVGFIKGFLGGVVTDEPRATLIGREILASGGTAADAAVALSLTLSVTLPSSASLGGGGICVVHDFHTKKTKTLDFLAGIPKNIPSTAVVPTAVPGFVRGLAVLHVKNGRLKWEQLVSPAETLARFGNQVSRAFSNDLRLLSPVQLTDPEFRKILTQKEGGRLIQEGDFIKQLDLASVLGRLRARGAGDFYTGLMGRQLVASVTKMGGSLSLEDLRAYKPIWRPTLKVPFVKSTTFHFPMSAGHSGVLAGQIIGMFIENGDWEDSSPPERAHLMAEIVSRAFAGRVRWLRNDGTSAVEPMDLVSESNIEKMIADFKPERHTPIGNAGTPTVSHHGNSTGTSFVVVDREGSAVA